jgi:hypothetical protein
MGLMLERCQMCHFLIQITCKFFDSAAFQALSTMEILSFLTYILQFRSYLWTPGGMRTHSAS